jgi:hypothetical protein
MSNNLVQDFVNALINGNDSRHPLNDFEEKIDSPNHFLKQQFFDFRDILDSLDLRNQINFFPCDVKGNCHEIAMFVSFRKPPLKFKMPKSNFVSLDIVLKQMVKQVLGSCFRKNQKIILLTDQMSNSKSEEWHENIKTIQKECKSIEIYYMFPNGKYENANRFFGL